MQTDFQVPSQFQTLLLTGPDAGYAGVHSQAETCVPKLCVRKMCSCCV